MSVRRTQLLISVAPVWVVTTVVLLSLWPVGLAARHLVVLALFGGSLVELSLLGFKKVPFTCSYLPGKGNVHFVFWMAVTLGIPVAYQAAFFEEVLLKTPLGCLSLIVLLSGIWAGVWWHTNVQARIAAGLKFEEITDPAIFELKLDRGSALPLR